MTLEESIERLVGEAVKSAGGRRPSRAAAGGPASPSLHWRDELDPH